MLKSIKFSIISGILSLLIWSCSRTECVPPESAFLFRVVDEEGADLFKTPEGMRIIAGLRDDSSPDYVPVEVSDLRMDTASIGFFSAEENQTTSQLTHIFASAQMLDLPVLNRSIETYGFRIFERSTDEEYGFVRLLVDSVANPCGVSYEMMNGYYYRRPNQDSYTELPVPQQVGIYRDVYTIVVTEDQLSSSNGTN